MYGAGAVGGVLGARLHAAGADVVLVARGAHLEAIRTHGLCVQSPVGETTMEVATAAGAAEIEWDGETVVLLAVKSHQSAPALLDLAAHAFPATPVVCVQNGVANEPAALRFFEQVYAVCVMMPTAHLEPGIVQAHCDPVPGILDVGRYPEGVDAVTRDVAAAFASAGFVSEPTPDIMAWKRRKLLANLANAVQACCGSGPEAVTLIDRARAEGEAVLAAAGLDVVSAERDRERRGDILQVASVDGQERAGGSSWQSMRRATGSIETDYLNGEIVLLGRLHAVPTPVNELIRRTALRMARDRAEPGSLPVVELLRELDGLRAP